MSGEADRRTLIRRVSFDLTGIPPTPDEVAKFLSDKTRDAYARVVDRLLVSPRYVKSRHGFGWTLFAMPILAAFMATIRFRRGPIATTFCVRSVITNLSINSPASSLPVT